MFLLFLCDDKKNLATVLHKEKCQFEIINKNLATRVQTNFFKKNF